MIFTQEILFHIAVFILATAGFFVAQHIRNHKVNNKVLVCPMNMDCHGVVHSDYSTMFGFPVELLGMIYYAFISVASILLIFLPGQMPLVLSTIMSGASVLAFTFSVYLICIQIFVLKKGCYWCFVSAVFCLLIFIFTLISHNLIDLSPFITSSI
jgi:uncharacterized membrane protein